MKNLKRFIIRPLAVFVFLLLTSACFIALTGCGDSGDDLGVATPSALCLDECEANIGTRDAQTCVVTNCGTMRPPQ